MSAAVVIAGWPGPVGTRLAATLQQRGRPTTLAATPEGIDGVSAAALVLLPGPPSIPTGIQAAMLTAFCGRARQAGVPRLVYWGSAAVYQAAAVGVPRQETHALDAAAAATLLERAVSEGAGEHPGLCIFRAVAVVGTQDDWVARARGCRALPTWPAAVIQLLHVSDAVDVLLRAVEGGHPGTYNVAGDGLLRWSEALRALDVRPLACPRGLAGLWLRRAVQSPELLAQLAGRTIVDTARLKTHFGYRPRTAARESLASARNAMDAARPAAAPVGR